MQSKAQRNRASILHRLQCFMAEPYALHTIVLRDLYDFLDVISFTLTAKATGTPSSARRTFAFGPKDALTNLNQQEIGA